MNIDTNIAFGMTLNNFIQIELSIGTLATAHVSGSLCYRGIPALQCYLLEHESETEGAALSARSIGDASAEQNVAQLMNATNQPITIQAGQVIGRLHATMDSTQKAARYYETNSVTSSLADERAFQEALAEFDINPGLSDLQLKQITQMLYSNRKAFAYGNRKLGSTDWATMTLDTGDSAPFLRHLTKPPLTGEG
jgi:hypothetical protein